MLDLKTSNLNTNKEKNRESSFELLRIVSMILIISHHYAFHGGFDMKVGLNINKAFVWYLSIGGKLGVNLFVFISGYFLVDSNFKLRKLLKIMFEVFFYSVVVFIIFVILDLGDIDIKLILKSFFPITFSGYWFATSYILMYILSPFLNEFIHSISLKRYKNLMLILTIIFSIIPTFTSATPGMSNLAWFIYLYLLAGYIKNNTIKIKNCNLFSKRKNCGIIFVISYSLIYISVIVFELIGFKYPIIRRFAGYFALKNSVLILICTISLFMFFKYTKIKYNKLINIFASSTFGIYLLHDSILRNFIWHNIFNNAKYFESRLLPIHAIFTIIIVFVSCMFVDLARKRLIEIPFFKFVTKTKIEDKIIISFSKMFD